MKRGLTSLIVAELSEHLPRDFQLVGQRLMRRTGRWVQLVRINPSRWDDTFLPTAALDFLPLSDPPPAILGGVAEQAVHGPRHPVERWYSRREFEHDPAAVAATMLEQFRPRLDRPLNVAAIEMLLTSRDREWPCLYCLCVMSTERRDREAAERWFQRYLDLTSAVPDIDRRASLRRVLGLINEPETLAALLDGMSEEKRASLKGRPLG